MLEPTILDSSSGRKLADYFRVARQNEAAGAADAAAWVMSAVLIFGSDNCGSQGGSL